VLVVCVCGWVSGCVEYDIHVYVRMTCVFMYT
jgi:hypothetical protein